jgi:hypothetical protein
VKPNEVDNREANQQQRTANGLRSGQMTSGEAARTNENQAKVAQQVHNERTANGGALTKQQKQQVNKEQNKNSKQIYNEKHNNRFGVPAGTRKPETTVKVALPNGAAGVDRLPPPFPPPPDAVTPAATPPPEGISLLGARTARLQVCSMGAKVKSSLSSWPVTMRP